MFRGRLLSDRRNGIVLPRQSIAYKVDLVILLIDGADEEVLCNYLSQSQVMYDSNLETTYLKCFPGVHGTCTKVLQQKYDPSLYPLPVSPNTRG